VSRACLIYIYFVFDHGVNSHSFVLHAEHAIWSHKCPTNAYNRALTYVPFAIQLRAPVLNALRQLLIIATATTTSSSSEDLTLIALCTLRSIKVHLHQFALARYTNASYGTLPSELYDAINRCNMVVAPSSWSQSFSDEVTSALTFGFEFFYESNDQQWDALASLLESPSNDTPQSLNLLAAIFPSITDFSGSLRLADSLTSGVSHLSFPSLQHLSFFLCGFCLQNGESERSAQRFVNAVLERLRVAALSPQPVSLAASSSGETKGETKTPSSATPTPAILQQPLLSILEQLEKHLLSRHYAAIMYAKEESDRKASAQNRASLELKERMEQKMKEQNDQKDENGKDEKGNDSKEGKKGKEGKTEEKGDDSKETKESKDPVSATAGDANGDSSLLTPVIEKRASEDEEAAAAAAQAAADELSGAADRDRQRSSLLWFINTLTTMIDGLVEKQIVALTTATTEQAHAIHASFFNWTSLLSNMLRTLISPLVTSLIGISTSPSVGEPLARALPSLQSLLHHLARFSTGLNALAIAKKESPQQAQVYDRIIESDHPYRAFLDREVLLSASPSLAPSLCLSSTAGSTAAIPSFDPSSTGVPAAVTLTFDTKCSTASPQDYVQVFACHPSRIVRQTPLSPRFYGPAGGGTWPTKPLQFTHKHVVLYFHSSGARVAPGQPLTSHYGFRVHVNVAQREKTPKPEGFKWLHTLLQTSSYLIALLAGHLITGSHETETEQNHARWLRTSLFGQGKQSPLSLTTSGEFKATATAAGSDAVTADQFLADMIAYRSGPEVKAHKLAERFIDRMRASGGGNTFVSSNIVEAAHICTQYTFAVLLKHSGRTIQAIGAAKTSNDTTIPSTIITLWRTAVDVRQQLRAVGDQPHLPVAANINLRAAYLLTLLPAIPKPIAPSSSVGAVAASS
jgi:hypothetical protein